MRSAWATASRASANLRAPAMEPERSSTRATSTGRRSARAGASGAVMAARR